MAEATTQEQDVRQLIRQPESATLEFKSYTPDQSTIDQLMAAFANTDGGTLVVGVREGGEVAGADVQRLRLLVERVRQRTTPPLEIRLDTPQVDGKQIGIVRVGRSAATPVFTDGGVYVRIGDKVRPMPAGDLVQRLERAKAPPKQADLAAAIANQTEIIESLREELREAHGWKGKLKDYFIGGMIGAVLGALVGLVIK